MAKLAYTRSNAGAPGIGVAAAARVWPAVRAAAVPAAIVLLALFLRVFRLELQAWTPDTYEQMNAAHRLVSGQFPISTFYPPGVAVVLAPAFVLFPNTLATQQAVVITSSLVLVVAMYLGAKHATSDPVAPVLAAFGAAAAPQIVYFSRDGFFDAMNAAGIVSLILVVPWLRGRSLPVFAIYGVLLAIAISIRATNPAYLPALVIYWADVGRKDLSPARIWRASFRVELLLAGACMIAAYVAFASLSGGVLGNGASAATLEYAGKNVVFYAITEFGGPLGLPFIAPLAIVGATYLWRHNCTLLLVSVYMLTIFPLAHVPLPFANTRYMLPSVAFALLLAAYAPAAVIEATRRQPIATRTGWRVLGAGFLLLAGAYFVATDVQTLAKWPATAAKSDEAAYRQLRPVIAALPDDALVVSGGTRGVRDSNSRIEYLDLIDYSLTSDNGPQRVEQIMQRIQRELDGGRPVYYMYTSVEGINITFTASGPGYQPYFDAAEQRFRMTETFATNLKFFKLYKIDGRR
jgi:hypothetical protein